LRDPHLDVDPLPIRNDNIIDSERFIAVLGFNIDSASSICVKEESEDSFKLQDVSLGKRIEDSFTDY
jgi:hypothetical protein